VVDPLAAYQIIRLGARPIKADVKPDQITLSERFRNVLRDQQRIGRQTGMQPVMVGEVDDLKDIFSSQRLPPR
jgi:hypothetical protein